MLRLDDAGASCLADSVFTSIGFEVRLATGLGARGNVRRGSHKQAAVGELLLQAKLVGRQGVAIRLAVVGASGSAQSGLQSR